MAMFVEQLTSMNNMLLFQTRVELEAQFWWWMTANIFS